jgi:hypothetical protein
MKRISGEKIMRKEVPQKKISENYNGIAFLGYRTSNY